MMFDNLTIRQTELLDKLWSMQSSQELFDWKQTLNDEDYRMSGVLQDMLIYEFIDMNLGDYVDDARAAIDHILAK